VDVTVRPEQIKQLIARAQARDASVLPALREFLDGNPDVWRRLGDLAVHARDALLAAADSLLARESMARRMDELEAELAGTSPTPLERVLAHRVALTWAQAHLADLDALQNDRGATPLAAHALRRQESAAPLRAGGQEPGHRAPAAAVRRRLGAALPARRLAGRSLSPAPRRSPLGLGTRRTMCPPATGVISYDGRIDADGQSRRPRPRVGPRPHPVSEAGGAHGRDSGRAHRRAQL
jgi:hypothetical protein